MEIEHEVFLKNELIQTFANSYWYDTANPYFGCLKNLKDLKNKLQDYPLYIRSFGEGYLINNEAEFLDWVQHVFGGGFEKEL
ncbi:MAG: hypothetical protein CMO01_29970 [Thalassobius sp.]|nr:hypothetical protein [Thalassovita sp.]